MNAAWVDRRRRLQNLPVGRFLLWTLSVAYGAAVLLRRLAYDLGLAKISAIPPRVICIGNLTTGGTGKTPAVLLAAQTLRKRNHAVSILSRGYGRQKKDEAIRVLSDDQARLPWTEVGDEPWMMQQALAGQGVPILISSDRVRAGAQACADFRSRVVILDDGFQHRKLKRDLDIVLVNAADPFGGRRLLPLGDLREPISSLSRAHMVLLTHVDLVSESAVSALRAEIKALNPEAAILESAHKADFLLDAATQKKHRLSHLEGKEASAFSGLASPASFEGQLEKCGIKLTQRWRYPDHHRYTLTELRSLESLRGGRPVVTTFKDFTRLPEGWQLELTGELYILAIKLEIMKGRNIWTDRLVALAGEAE